MQQQPIMEPDRHWIWVFVATAVVIAVALGVWQWRSHSGKGNPHPVLEETATNPPPPPSALPHIPPPEKIVTDQTPDSTWAAVIEAFDSTPVQPSSEDAARARQAFSGLLGALEEQDARNRGKAGYYGLVSSLTRELAENPPFPSGELSDPKRFLANVFHISRVLGKKRTLELKAMLTGQHRQLEPLAAACYQWLITRDSAADLAERKITLPVLYDYASYMLGSFGGRAYLQRRSPRQEALATFYAVMVVDRAAQAGISNHGTDPRLHLERCRQLLETQDLVYRKQYLAALDRLASRWP